MPAVSRKQWKFMKLLEHNPEKVKKKGVKMTPEQAVEYTSHNKGKMVYKKLPEKK